MGPWGPGGPCGDICLLRPCSLRLMSARMRKLLMWMNKWKSQGEIKLAKCPFSPEGPSFPGWPCELLTEILYYYTGLWRNTTMALLTESLHVYFDGVCQTKEREKKGFHYTQCHLGFLQLWCEFPIKSKQQTSKGNWFGSNETKALCKDNHFTSMSMHKLLQSGVMGKLTLRGRICGWWKQQQITA